MRDIDNIKRLIVKVGSSSLCNKDGQIEQTKVLNLVLQISKLKQQGYEIVFVTSGAIAAGMGIMELAEKPRTIPQKQALAAIGQAQLMQIYENVFQMFGLKCAQVLLNHDDFDDRKRMMNLSNTMQALMDYGVIPIVNENDALAVDEIKVGDNDTLAALLVPVVAADLLILVSDIDGLYTANPHKDAFAKRLSFVDCVDEEIQNMAGDATSRLGTGGMATKIYAAKIVNDYGSHMVIVNGQDEHCLLDVFSDLDKGTWFNGLSGKNLKAKAHWLTYRCLSKGQIVVDQGAKQAIQRDRKSLLPKGIVSVADDFLMGQVVDIVDQEGHKIAKGISNYSSEEIKVIKGHDSCEIPSLLENKDYDEVIHANNMVVLGGNNNAKR